jgi:hypothetical protein
MNKPSKETEVFTTVCFFGSLFGLNHQICFDVLCCLLKVIVVNFEVFPFVKPTALLILVTRAIYARSEEFRFHFLSHKKIKFG